MISSKRPEPFYSNHNYKTTGLVLLFAYTPFVLLIRLTCHTAHIRDAVHLLLCTKYWHPSTSPLSWYDVSAGGSFSEQQRHWYGYGSVYVFHITQSKSIVALYTAGSLYKGTVNKKKTNTAWIRIWIKWIILRTDPLTRWIFFGVARIESVTWLIMYITVFQSKHRVGVCFYSVKYWSWNSNVPGYKKKILTSDISQNFGKLSPVQLLSWCTGM